MIWLVFMKLYLSTCLLICCLYLQLKYDSISGSQANLQFRIKRIEEERDFLTEQNSQISLDLSRKTAELSALQRETV